MGKLYDDSEKTNRIEIIIIILNKSTYTGLHIIKAQNDLTQTQFWLVRSFETRRAVPAQQAPSARTREYPKALEGMQSVTD